MNRYMSIFLFWLAILGSVLALKYSLSGSSLISISKYHWSLSESFDQSTTYAAVKNYLDSGFSNHAGIQNRKGILMHGQFGIPCIGAGDTALRLNNYEGRSVEVKSYDQACYYVKVPPLYFWMLASLAKVTQSYHSIHLVNVLMMLFFALGCFLYASHLTRPRPAFISSILLTALPFFLGMDKLSL